MDQSDPNQQQVVGVGAASGQMAAYGGSSYPYQSGTSAQPQTGFSNPQHQIAYQQAQQFHHQHHQHHQHYEQLQAFWASQKEEIEHTTDFKNHSLPLARIKKIMKADEDVRMISAEAPVVFAKACEMFILELTLQSWLHTEENKRRTLQKNDIAAAISRTDVFDFLVDIIPRDEVKEEGLGVTKASIPMVESTAESIPYYYIPPQQQQNAGPSRMMQNAGPSGMMQNAGPSGMVKNAGPSGMIMGKSVVDEGAIYGDQQHGQPVAYMPWNSTQQRQHAE